MDASIAVRNFLERSWPAAQHAALDDIFYSSSATQHFASAAERAAFRERWLGRYLLVDAQHCFLAFDQRDALIGYLAGSLDDPARQARFADLPSARFFAAHSAKYPAHLHINVAESARNSGAGAKLVEAFARHATSAGAVGMHVVTSSTSRNVRFYERCGFSEKARQENTAGATVFLGCDLPRA